jgi:rubredoxin
MGYRPYRGPIRTLGQAVFADMPVQVVCDGCRHFRQLHAFRLVQQIGKKADARALPLFTPIKDFFYCRSCGKRVSATIFAPLDSV